MPTVWHRNDAEWSHTTGAVWYQQVGSWFNGECVYVNFRTNQELASATLMTTVDGGSMEQREWTETPAVLTHSELHWKASATVPPRITAWFIKLESPAGITNSNLMDLG